MTGKILPIDDVEPGMVLAAAVLDAGGGVLLPQGGVLSEATLASLRRREVAMLCVDIPEPAREPEVRQILRQAVEQRLQFLFRQAGDEPATRALFQAVLDYRLEKLR